MKTLLYLFIALILTCYSCNSNKSKIATQIKELYNKEIKFCNNNHFFIHGKDTILSKLNEGNYKIVFFADSSNCEICDFKLGEWSIKMKEIYFYTSDVNFIFIIQSKNYHEFEHYAQESLPEFPFIYDSKGDFIKENQLPQDSRFRVFLLDKSNKIRIVGSPIGSDYLWEIYKKEILKADYYKY